MFPVRKLLWIPCVLGSAVLWFSPSLQSQVHPPPTAPPSLKTITSSTDPKKFPQPDTSAYVQDSTALIQLGKAFFWDMQMGSDGVQACASLCVDFSRSGKEMPLSGAPPHRCRCSIRAWPCGRA